MSVASHDATRDGIPGHRKHGAQQKHAAQVGAREVAGEIRGGVGANRPGRDRVAGGIVERKGERSQGTCVVKAGDADLQPPLRTALPERC